MATFAKIAEALVYGWTINYFVEIEGVAVLLKEQDFGSTDPTGYTSDACLVIDDSASVGSIVDRKKGIGRGFDLSLRLLDTAAVRTLFTAPSKTELTVDIQSIDDASNARFATVTSTTAFDASGVFYIGVEAIPYASKTATTLVYDSSPPRGTYGKAYDHSSESMVGTAVTTGPRWWRGRGVKLWAAAVDPMGNVPGDDLRDEAACIWKGTIDTNPMRVDGLWAMEARSIDRKLDRDLTSPVSGTATWSFEDDHEMQIDPLLTYNFHVSIAQTDTTTGVDTWVQTLYTVRPFIGLAAIYKHRFSAQRELMRDAWATAVGGVVGDLVWTKHIAIDAAGPTTLYKAAFRVTQAAVAGKTLTVWVSSGKLAGKFGGLDATGNAESGALPNVGGDYICDTGLRWSVLLGQANLSVRVDSGDPADIPATGYIILETDAGRDWFEYASATADPADPQAVLVSFADTNQDITGLVFDAIQGENTEISVSFALKDSGLAKDTMRRMLMSSGRGDNGANLTADMTDYTADSTIGSADTTGTDPGFDSLPLQQGYDIEGVDTESFDNVLDGAFQMLSLDLLLDSGASFTKIYGGMLSLSQRAVVPVSVPGDVDLRAVHTGLSDSGANLLTIVDTDLVTTGSTAAVRPKAAINNPNKVTAKLASLSDSTSGEIVANDLSAMRAHGTTQWAVTMHGAKRSQWVSNVIGWSRALFATSQMAQIVEIDVRPSLDISVGQAIRIDSSHYSLWQYSTGTPGYTGFARVLGRQIGLASGVQTLTVVVDGVVSGQALSPSARIIGWQETAAAPSLIRLPIAYAPVMEQYIAGLNPFRLMAYIPGSEDATDNGYDINLVTRNGPEVELTVDAQNGVFTITEDWYLTLPSVPNSSTEELYYIHTNTAGAWI